MSSKKSKAATRVQEPWHRAVYGERFYLLVDEITARCVAEGVVTARLQMQAKQMVDFLHLTESEDAVPGNADRA